MEDQRAAKRRPHCGLCCRPLRACLCSVLPLPPLQPHLTRVFVLQHPHEARHKLATVPVLRLCLANCDVLVGRRFLPGCSPLLDRLSSRSDLCRSSQALLLFPSSAATDLRSWLLAHRSSPCRRCDAVVRTTLGSPRAVSQAGALHPFNAHFVLLVVDATWKHAREMVKASLPFLRSFVVQVCLPFDANAPAGGAETSELILRKEPFAGCVSTMEAVASCLKILEADGLEIEDRLLAVLKAMAQFQASHITAPKVRVTQPERKTL